MFCWQVIDYERRLAKTYPSYAWAESDLVREYKISHTPSSWMADI